MPANIDERKVTASSPFLLVKKLARMKAERVASSMQYVAGKKNPHATCYQLHTTIIAADSLAIIETKRVKDKNLVHQLTKFRLGNYFVFGKPTTKKEAILFLSTISNTYHYFVTGLFVKRVKGKVIHQSVTKSKLVFKKITTSEIEKYVDTQPVLTFAGSYQIEKGTPGEKFVKKITGSYTNVLGLPAEKIKKFLLRSQR